MRKLVPKKVRKQLDREIPFELIPVAHKHLYEAAILKEWQEWLGWDAVGILSRAESEQLWQDPGFRRAGIPTRFAFRNKHAGRDPTELKRLNLALVAAKARLCIQGFRQKNKHLLRKDSPTISRVGFFCVLQVVCSCNFTLFSGDCSSAFMQDGQDPSGDMIYLSQPRNGRLPGLHPRQVLRMKGSGYGKVDAPRLWFRVLIGFLLSEGWVQHGMDPCIAMLYCSETSVIVAVLGIHVDDIIGGCIDAKYLQPLRDRFKFGDFRWSSVEFCGREVI